MSKELIMKLDMQWQALRYAVDMLDVAWSYYSDEYGEGKLKDEKKIEMKAHRRTLCEMQDEILSQKRLHEMLDEK